MGTTVTSADEIALAAEQAMAQPPVPGMVVGISQDGEQKIHGYGVANVESGVPVTNSAQGSAANERMESWLLGEYCGLRSSPQWDRLRLALRWRAWRLRLVAGVIAWRLRVPLVD